jgi:azurin
LDEEDFQKSDPNQQKIILRDTVRLEFLDDGYIQKELTEVELSFKHTNSFSQEVVNTISFLSENNQAQYVVKLNVEAGSENNPTEKEKTELIKAEQIGGIKRSIKMVMEVEVLPNNEPISGELKFESKGLFSFEF